MSHYLDVKHFVSREVETLATQIIKNDFKTKHLVAAQSVMMFFLTHVQRWLGLGIDLKWSGSRQPISQATGPEQIGLWFDLVVTHLMILVDPKLTH